MKSLRKVTLIAGLAVVTGWLVACGRRDSMLGVVALLVEEPKPQPPATASPGPTASPEPSRTPNLTPPPQIDEACVDCHTDQELLQALATEAEPTESLSTGEG